MTGYPLIKKKKEKFTFAKLLSILKKRRSSSQAKAVIKKVVRLSNEEKEFYDFTGEENTEKQQLNADSITVNDMLDKIKEHKVYGFGGAAFSTYDKIKTFSEAKASHRYLIVNGVECDPGLLHDAWILRHRMDEVEKGIYILMKCFCFDKVILAVKNSENIRNIEKVEMRVVPDCYPMGAERILIKELLGQEISRNNIPAKEGFLALNVQTIYAVYEAVYLNRDASTKFLTVADIPNGTAAIAKVKLGANMAEIMKEIYGEGKERKLFSGGGIMQGQEISKETMIGPEINLIAYGNRPSYKENAKCAKCGACSRACPMGLKVNKIIQKLENGDTKGLAMLHPENCIGCGACSYSCRADKILSQKIYDYRVQV